MLYLTGLEDRVEGKGGRGREREGKGGERGGREVITHTTKC